MCQAYEIINICTFPLVAIRSYTVDVSYKLVVFSDYFGGCFGGFFAFNFCETYDIEIFYIIYLFISILKKKVSQMCKKKIKSQKDNSDCTLIAFFPCFKTESFSLSF